MKIDGALRYGTVLIDDNFYDRCDEMASYIRVRIISYQGEIYYHKMIDGEVVEFKKVGVVG